MSKQPVCLVFVEKKEVVSLVVYLTDDLFLTQILDKIIRENELKYSQYLNFKLMGKLPPVSNSSDISDSTDNLLGLPCSPNNDDWMYELYDCFGVGDCTVLEPKKS